MRLAGFKDGHAGVRGAEVDAKDFAHNVQERLDLPFGTERAHGLSRSTPLEA